ncbi:uncharacterized protein BT62DRAFT_1078890 [Guyanagaster necrorhizus]|uniref:Uncharacterized protein n=1 Tax=Guyanagaster necrorhizus TaxID=856835 RepID=A0A9P7VMB7_9AGAR|nr:uncharacterized protein BT62DRAFT_1078890 [Guyanagaster necrorhizus MCA 3950]KAG7443168.1 hypothetical protein BT62DRAFT_1078890 [Guyanagaster necrorhizus MCA 3950]
MHDKGSMKNDILRRMKGSGRLVIPGWIRETTGSESVRGLVLPGWQKLQEPLTTAQGAAKMYEMRPRTVPIRIQGHTEIIVAKMESQRQCFNLFRTEYCRFEPSDCRNVDGGGDDHKLQSASIGSHGWGRTADASLLKNTAPGRRSKENTINNQLLEMRAIPFDLPYKGQRNGFVDAKGSQIWKESIEAHDISCCSVRSNTSHPTRQVANFVHRKQDLGQESIQDGKYRYPQNGVLYSTINGSPIRGKYPTSSAYPSFLSWDRSFISFYPIPEAKDSIGKLMISGVNVININFPGALGVIPSLREQNSVDSVNLPQFTPRSSSLQPGHLLLV